MPKKIKIKNSDIKEENGNIVVTFPIDEEISDETDEMDLTSKLREFIGTKTDIEIKPKSNRKAPERKPTFKYICSGCKTEISSKIEGLIVECKECGELFEPKQD